MQRENLIDSETTETTMGQEDPAAGGGEKGKRTGELNVVLTQTGVLFRKDMIVLTRHRFKTVISCICPAFALFFGCIGALVLSLTCEDGDNTCQPKTYEYTTNEYLTMGITDSFTFDPFPNMCANMAPPDDGLIDQSDWRQEPRVPLEEYTKFDCMIRSFSTVMPFWKNLLSQLRQKPQWTPEPLVFGVSPGKQGDETTIGGKYFTLCLEIPITVCGRPLEVCQTD